MTQRFQTLSETLRYQWVSNTVGDSLNGTNFSLHFIFNHTIGLASDLRADSCATESGGTILDRQGSTHGRHELGELHTYTFLPFLVWICSACEEWRPTISYHARKTVCTERSSFIDK